MTTESAWKSANSDDESRLDYSITEKIVDEVYGTKYQFLSADALERVTDTNDYYNYYDLEGQYWTMPRALGYEPTIMPVNLARWFVRKRTGWLFETAPDIECPPERVDAEEAMETQGYEPSEAQKKANDLAAGREELLYRVWGENKHEEKLLEAGKDFYVGGTVALKIRYLPGRGIRLNYSPAQEVFPIMDDDDPSVLKSVTFCSFLDNDQTIWKQTWEMSADGKHCLIWEGTYDLELHQLSSKYNADDTKLDFIPVLIFPRDCTSGQVFGTSYLKDLIPLFDRYNRTMSDAADSLRFNLFAVTVFLNAAPDAEKNLKVRPGEVWNIGGDEVDVKKLESSFNYSTALADFLTRLENVMHLVADVPDITPDRIKGFGLVSGVALKLLYSDLVSATEQDWRVWKSRLVDANKYILRMAEIFKVEGYENIKGNYDNRIITHLPLPENEMEKISMEQNKLSSSLTSIKKALQELGDKYPERTIAEIITERERFGMPDLGTKINVTEMEQITGA